MSLPTRPQRYCDPASLVIQDADWIGVCHLSNNLAKGTARKLYIYDSFYPFIHTGIHLDNINFVIWMQ